MQTFVIDLDGTINKTPQFITHSKEEFMSAEPNWGIIYKMRKLKQAGHLIIIFTSRGWFDQDHTLEWLLKYEVPFDHLVMGKPRGPTHDTWYLDDRNISFEDFLTKDW